MDEAEQKIFLEKKEILLKVIGKIVYQKRKELGIGINKFSFEYDLGNGLISKLERGISDTKISTLWKISNAVELKFSDFALMVESELPRNFSFYE